jgi:hypothetical protein
MDPFVMKKCSCAVSRDIPIILANLNGLVEIVRGIDSLESHLIL